MLKNYWKTAWRLFYRYKNYTLINISGLVAGLVVFMLIGLWCYDEISFNKNHDNYDRIAQLKRFQTWEGRTSTQNWHGTALGNHLRSFYQTSFEKVVMMSRTEEHIISFGIKNFTQLGNYMESGAPQMLTLRMRGGTSTGLQGSNTIFLSHSLTDKLFGGEDPIGQIVTLDGNIPLSVTGVYEDLPHNSEFHEITYILPMDLYYSMTGAGSDLWTGGNMLVYVQLNLGADLELASGSIKNIMDPYIDEQTAAYQPELFLFPMGKWHLQSEFENGKPITSKRLKSVWLFGAIGFFVLVLACINFMNLSTARVEKRVKEIAVRKVFGSSRKSLIAQFLVESMSLALLSILIAVAIVWITLPWFNDIAGKEISFPFSNQWFWVACFALALFTGILAGSYPALYLSSFGSGWSLKENVRTGQFALIVRKSLIVFQFTISISLIVGTLVVFQQIQYAQNRPVGYQRSGLLMIPKLVGDLYGKHDILREELKNTGVVSEVAQANYPLTSIRGTFGGIEWTGKTEQVTFNAIKVNQEYGRTIGWELVEGRDFSRDFQTDRTGVIITENAREKMGLANPIGENIQVKTGFFGGHNFTILGVVKDMIKGSPFQPHYPGMMFLANEELEWMFIRVKPNVSTREALRKIEMVFRDLAPGAPFDFKFADDEYQAKFKAEVQIGRLVNVFASLAIFISCLGLLGLAAFITELRTKEVSIRKVLGASIPELWAMLSKDFTILVVLSGLIAIPIAYHFLYKWLQQYAYRIEIPWWIFLATGFGTLLLALVTTSFHAIKIAQENPISNLQE